MVTIPVVSCDNETGVLQTTSPIVVGTPEWFAWIQDAPCFQVIASDANSGIQVLEKDTRYLARREKRRNSYFWYLYKKVSGKTFKKYLGSPDRVTVAAILCAVEELQTTVWIAQSQGQLPLKPIKKLAAAPINKRAHRVYSANALPAAPKLDSVAFKGLSFTAKLIAEYFGITPRQVTYAIEKLGINPAEKRILYNKLETGQRDLHSQRVYHKYSVDDINRIAEHIKGAKVSPDCQLLKMAQPGKQGGEGKEVKWGKLGKGKGKKCC